MVRTDLRFKVNEGDETGIGCNSTAHDLIYDKFCRNATGSGEFQHPVRETLRAEDSQMTYSRNGKDANN
jgi:hypothetical protein